jgi:hypothetical protein
MDESVAKGVYFDQRQKKEEEMLLVGSEVAVVAEMVSVLILKVSQQNLFL